MKIENVAAHLNEPALRTAVEKQEQIQTEKVFTRTLTNLVESEQESVIQNKLEAVIAQGEKLNEKADLAQLNKYKEMIRDLINHTVSNGFQFTKSNKFDSRGRAKVYASIKKINHHLDDMTQQILESERENIDLVAQINDIRGLLVDMFM